MEMVCVCARAGSGVRVRCGMGQSDDGGDEKRNESFFVFFLLITEKTRTDFFRSDNKREVFVINVYCGSAVHNSLSPSGQELIVLPKSFSFARAACSAPILLTCSRKKNVAFSGITNNW
jgi:hypothetical protein